VLAVTSPREAQLSAAGGEVSVSNQPDVGLAVRRPGLPGVC
jgi:hypothetical protein